MNKLLNVALVCLPIGFASGWLAKPSNDSKIVKSTPIAASVQESEPKKKLPRPGSLSPSQKARKQPTMGSSFTINGDSADELSPEMKKMVEDAKNSQMDMMSKSVAGKFDLRIASMVAKLGLDAAQESALRAFFDGQLKKIDPSLMMAGGSPEKYAEMAAALRGDGLKEFMADQLDEKQLEEFDALEKRKHENKVESAALKNLAKLQQTLDLSDSQKDEIFGLYVENAKQKLDNQSDSSFVSEAMMSSMGVSMDLEEMGLESVMEMPEMTGGEMDQATMMQFMKDSRQKKIDQKVKKLSPILNENQLSQYRKSLENKGSAMNMIIQNVEGASSN